MNSSTYQLAATMVNQFSRVDMISNNIANVNTNGFKQENLVEGSFNNYLNRAKNDGSNLDEMNKLINTVPKIDGKFIMGQQGDLQVTANELDFALNTPDTFFKIQNQNGEIEYTRDGSFKNLNGMLVDGNGNSVLSVDNEPLVVEGEFASLIGVIKTPFNNLEKVGDNNYKVKDFAQVELLDGNEEYVVQGAVEKSNVSAVSSMVQLIDAQRRAEQAQTMFKSKSELNGKLIEKVGTPR